MCYIFAQLVFLVLPALSAAIVPVEGQLKVLACNPLDSGQQWTFDTNTGQLSVTFDSVRFCAVVNGCALESDAAVVLAPCETANNAATCSSDWSLMKPQHPVPNVDSPMFLVAPTSLSTAPYCLENVNRKIGGSVEVYCCSGEVKNCSSVYPTPLPFEQWLLPASGNGLVKNLADGVGGMCLAALAPPKPPLTQVPVWPLPQHLKCVGTLDEQTGSFLSANVIVKISGSGLSSSVAIQAAARYQTLLQAAGTPAGGVTVVNVVVQSQDETLGRHTNYSYTVNYNASKSMSMYTVSVCAASPFGVAYALETLLQLAEEGAQSQCGGGFVVIDQPDFPHRGLMIDTGRRFYPISLVENLIEGLAMMKMSVLHMFLSEECFRVESKVYPALHLRNCTVGGVTNHGYYSQENITSLIEFAKLRGVRLIPEFDIPAHAGGWCDGLKTAGIQCCAKSEWSGVPQIEDDAQGKSVTIVSNVLKEMAELFPDSVMHIGGDETGTTEPCGLNNSKTFEQKILEFVANKLGKDVMGWEEVLFKTGAADGHPSFIVDSWARTNWQQAAEMGYRSVVSNSGSLYLDFQTTLSPEMWLDIRGGTTNITQLALLLGGETSMWNDMYVPGARGKHGIVPPTCLFNNSRDADFSNSTATTIWPRAAIAGGSFWNYDQALMGDSAVFEGVIEAVKLRLAARGVIVCPCATSTTFGCDQTQHCGTIWCPTH